MNANGRPEHELPAAGGTAPGVKAAPTTAAIAVEQKAQALLALVDAHRRRQCDAILAEARRRADATLRQAHADARARMEKAFAEERLRRDARIGAARANLQTHRRLAEQRRSAALLAAGWARLPEALLERWRSAEGRREWVAGVTAEARKSLPMTAWRITHAADWPADERDALALELGRERGLLCTFVADPATPAGLAIAERGNVVDGTIAGLLAERAEIGSRLLRLLDERDAAGRGNAATASGLGDAPASAAAADALPGVRDGAFLE